MIIDALASREAGDISRPLVKEYSSSITTLHRLELEHVLEGHSGCVNSVSFDESGNTLLSGSDDLCIILWDWRANRELRRYQSGHMSNVFQARALPGTSLGTVITCARDGQVRKGTLHPGGGDVSTTLLAAHRHSAHKLALDPQQPSCFLSCGEDGVVMRFDVRERQPVVWRMTCRLPSVVNPSDVRAKALYSVHCNPARAHQFGVSGRDPRVAIFDARMVGADVGADAQPAPSLLLQPRHLQPGVHGTCMQFSMWGEVLVTYNDEDAYMFAPPETTGQRRRKGAAPRGEGHARRGVRRRRRAMESSDDEVEDDSEDEAEEGAPVACFQGQRNSQTIKGISFFGHSDEYVVSGSDCGHCYIWHKRRPDRLEAWLEADAHVVNCLEPHPFEGLTLATSGIDDSIKIWAPIAEEPVQAGRMADRCMRRNLQEQGDDLPRGAVQEAFLSLLFNPELLQWAEAMQGDESADDEEEEEEDSDDAPIEGLD